MIDNQTSNKTVNNTISPGKKIFGIVATIVGGLIGYLIGRYLGWLYLIIIVIYLILLWQVYKFTQTHKLNKFVKGIIVWSNLITWFIPFVGFFISITTFGIAKVEKNIKYKILSLVGLILSIINGGIGFYQGLMKLI